MVRWSGWKLRGNHCLCSHELADEPIILCGRPHVARPRRQQRQQLLRRPELAAYIARTVQASSKRALARVGQSGAPPAHQPPD